LEKNKLFKKAIVSGIVGGESALDFEISAKSQPEIRFELAEVLGVCRWTQVVVCGPKKKRKIFGVFQNG